MLCISDCCPASGSVPVTSLECTVQSTGLSQPFRITPGGKVCFPPLLLRKRRLREKSLGQGFSAESG